MLELFDFLSVRGENLIGRWARDERLSARDRAILNQKLDRLLQMGFELAQKTKLLAGPVHGHVYKLRVFGDVMMRPMLCRGPLKIDQEYTLLLGAIERNGELRPADWKTSAVENREIVAQRPDRRCPHERV